MGTSLKVAHFALPDENGFSYKDNQLLLFSPLYLLPTYDLESEDVMRQGRYYFFILLPFLYKKHKVQFELLYIK